MFELFKAVVGFFFNRWRELFAGIIGRTMVGLGVGFTSHQLLMPSLLGYIQQRMAAMPANVVQLFAVLRIDQCITLILSAIAAAVAVRLVFSRRTAQ